jgi:hypothetical protein
MIAVSVLAPRYRKGRPPEWHFVPPGATRAVCGIVPTARIKGTRPVRSVTCETCSRPLWNWALRKTLNEWASHSWTQGKRSPLRYRDVLHRAKYRPIGRQS